MRSLVLGLALLMGCVHPALAPTIPRTIDPVALAVERTVRVDVDCEDDMLDTGGSAVLYRGDLVVTAAHVVDSVDPLTCVITLVNDKGKHRAYPVAGDTKLDLAILSSPTLMTDQVGLSPAKLGMDVWAVGYPSQLRNPFDNSQALTVTKGIVASLLIEPHLHRVTAPVFYGNSGGGVWSATGGLVGIVVEIRFWRGQFIESQARVVPVEVLMRWLETKV